MEPNIIKEKLKLPMHFVFPPVIRCSTLLFGFFGLACVFYIIFTRLTSDASLFVKIVPFVCIFLLYDSISRNLFSLNKITISENNLQFSYLLKKKMQIEWQDIVRLDSHFTKNKFFVIYYRTSPAKHIEGTEEILSKYYFPAAFKNVLDVINLIKLYAPHIETDEFVSSLIYLQKTGNDSL